MVAATGVAPHHLMGVSEDQYNEMGIWFLVYQDIVDALSRER